MSQLTIKLRSVPDVRFDISALLPAIQAGANTTTLERLPLAGDGKSLRLGDIATLSGSPGDTLLIEGCSDRIDGVGAGMGGGTLVVEGNVGAKAGLGMKAGRLDIKGSAGSYLASGLKSGIITSRARLVISAAASQPATALA